MGITQMRVELKYRVPPGRVGEFLERMPRGCARSSAVTTTYVDRPDGALARAARGSPFQSTKVRIREYHDDPSSVWLEVKTRTWAWTRKIRVRVERPLLGLLLTGRISSRLLSAPPGIAGEVDTLLGKLREEGGGELVLVGGVTVLRTTFAFPEDRLRVTLDEGITYHRIGNRTAGEAPSAPALAPRETILREEDAILEIKEAGERPPWCRNLAAGFPPTTYSKFLALLEALEGARASAHVD